MKRLLRLASVALLVGCMAMAANALPASKRLDQCRLDTWGIRDGLPGYDIAALAQTPDGYLWIGTTQGLLRFDGTSFTTFDSSNIRGLTNNTIRGLSVAHDGALLVGSEWSGYGKLVDGVYHRSNFPDDHWNATRYFHESPDGTLWVGYQGYHFIIRDHGSYAEKVDAPGLYLSGAVDIPGGILAGMLYGGLFTVETAGPAKPFHTVPEIGVNDFTAMTKTPDGSIWCGTASNGLYRIDGYRSIHYTAVNGLGSNIIRCLFVDRAGRLWIGTNNGIASFDKQGFHRFDVSDGLAANDVTAITEDHEGNLWVATGIYLNRFANTQLTPISIGSRDVQEVGGINTGPNGKLFYCSRSGLWLVDPKPDTVSRRITTWPVNQALSTPDGDIYAFWNLDNHDQSCVGRFHAGVWTFQKILFDPLALIEIGNTVYVVGVHQELQKFGSKTKGLVYPFVDNQFYIVKKDRHGTLWMGCDQGLAYYRNGKGGVTDCGLPAGAHVLSIDASDPKCLWLGTDKGVARVWGKAYETGSGPVTGLHSQIYGVDTGVPSNDCLQILRDHSGNIWIGGYFGIASIKPSEFDDYDAHRVKSIRARIFTSADGIHYYPIVGMPAETSDGTLWFIGTRGVTMIDPDHLAHNDLPPPLVIEECTANNRPLSAGSSNKIPPGAGSLIVRYAGLSYIEPEKVRFRYKLDGFDSTWQEAGTRRSAAYTNLPPGRYVFRVIACNNDGVWNTTGASIAFELLPHFYETIWFKCVLAIALIALVALIVRWRTGQIELRAKELESKVVERTSELVETNRQLTEVQEELKTQNIHLQESQAEVETQNDELHAMQAELLAQNDELQSVQAELEAQNQELTDTQEYLAEANHRLEALATTDGLTGLYNHRTFHEILEREWAHAARHGTQLSLTLLDVDRFKLYNDTFGHPAGDEVLRSVARILKSAARATDFVARYGGEEFVVVMPGTGADLGAEVAETLRAAIAETHWELREITASFGVATVDATTAVAADLISHADNALYRSKNAGRNRVTPYSAVADPSRIRASRESAEQRAA